MNTTAVRLLLPLVRDLANENPDEYLCGAVTGALDMLEKLGHITEPEYCLMADMAGRDVANLLDALESEDVESLTIPLETTGD